MVIEVGAGASSWGWALVDCAPDKHGGAPPGIMLSALTADHPAPV